MANSGIPRRAKIGLRTSAKWTPLRHNGLVSRSFEALVR
jgi:hypothetical protein